eukprot:5482987-Prorocentrum_lima.AAC.1
MVIQQGKRAIAPSLACEASEFPQSRWTRGSSASSRAAQDERPFFCDVDLPDQTLQVFAERYRNSGLLRWQVQQEVVEDFQEAQGQGCSDPSHDRD